MNNHENFMVRGPTWVWAYAEAHGLEIERTLELKEYEPIGEEK